jgi:hypothetical protein
MKLLNMPSLVLVTALVAMAESAYGTQPPDVVVSDGGANTAMGTSALLNLTTGNNNTASGENVLLANTSGSGNTASGFDALQANLSGTFNTASGYEALFVNTIGNNNTAFGVSALATNTTGSNNTASGYQALFQNTSGTYNTAHGIFALSNNTTGNNNTASGRGALGFNTTGSNNTASGYDALVLNTTGSNNIAEGYQAGYNLTTGSNNIDIGNVGVAGESNTIRIGTKGTQKATVIGGIYGTPVNGAAVVVSLTGRLGVTVSSERYKTAISPMGANSSKLQQLRPVTFHLKTDPRGALQYGLIAEEVAKVYPELVIRNEKGRIDGVRYDELAPMLLNEVQQQAAEITDLKQQMIELKDLKQELRAALLKLHAKDELVAQR